MPTLFISYKRDDKVAVLKIADRLNQQFHYDVWIDAVSIPGGEDWRAEIRKGIDKADVVLLMLTPDACASVQVKEEVDYANAVGRKILPLQIKKVSEDDQNKLGVAHLNYIDFVLSHDDRFAWEKLLNDLPEVLPRDKRMLEVRFKRLHQQYLRTLFTRYGSESLTYLLDAAPRESVKLMDVYVPLFLGVRLYGEIREKQLVDWWIGTERENEFRQAELSDHEKRPKQFSGFQADPAIIEAIIDRMRDFVAELADKRRDDFRDGERSLWRLESEEAPALVAHLVITGNPGSGKSTLMKHLALCLAGDGLHEGGESEADINRLGFWPLPAYTPIYIELRALIRTAFPDRRDEVMLAKFLDFLRTEQLQPYGLEGYMDDLTDQLREGSAMLFLDGLDEVPDADTSERREQIKDLIHLLRGQFKNCRILITSRPYAYAGDWQLRPEDGFGQVTLADLDSDRLQELALKLFRAVLPTEQVDMEVAAFTAQIASVPGELRKNPLFFTLMAAIWLNSQARPADQRLPVTKGAIYRECVEMLIKRWTRKDIEKGQSLVEAIGLDEVQLRKLLETLAYQIHSEQGDKDDAVFESGKIMTILRRDLGLRGLDYDLLVDALAQRAGVIYEREPEQFQFAHRSFQEHLSACYFAGREKYPALAVNQVQERPGWWRNVVDLLPDEAKRQRHNLWELVKAWLPGKDGTLPTERDAPEWLLIYYAAKLMFDHLPAEDDLQTVYRPSLVRPLAALVSIGALSAIDRAEMGRLLSELGDPRYGVGVKDGIPEIDWADIPAGLFLMGSDKNKDDLARDSEHPQHEVRLDTYRISRYLITYAQFQAFLDDEAEGFTNTKWWDGLAANDEHRAQPGEQRYPYANHPRENVSWWDAVAFCNWLSDKVGYEVRLPTEAEWERAARGEDGWIYPYEGEYDPAKGNTNEAGIGQTSAVGIFPDGASPYGVLDMSGNVWEWCSSQYRDYPYNADDGREDLSGETWRVVRGGSFFNFQVSARAAFRDFNRPVGRGYLIGFRVVCRPPSP